MSRSKLQFSALAAFAGAIFSLGLITAAAIGPVTGAIFTTDSACIGTNLNIYADKDAVYLDGGPTHTGAAGLPDGEYYVQVTGPDGSPLGSSVGSADDTPVAVADGEFASCYQLSSILIKASDNTAGYDDTASPGGEYKVWVSTASTFDNNQTKTDNFKVKPSAGGDSGTLRVRSFYDANANGLKDGPEPFVDGWKVRVQDGIDYIRHTSVEIALAPDDYTVTAFSPLQTNWVNTTANPVAVTLDAADDRTVSFGNVCLGAGGGLTLGFWSNKNGQARFGADDLALIVSLYLRNASGGNSDPATYAAFRTWILGGTATNMAYMLSAQLAAMELNVLNGFVSGQALVYAPALAGSPANETALGFITIADLMAAANTELELHGLTLSGSPYRGYQEALKSALDAANNNRNFVQATPCEFSFAE